MSAGRILSFIVCVVVLLSLGANHQLDGNTEDKRLDFLLGEIKRMTGHGLPMPKTHWIWAGKTADGQVCYFQRFVQIADVPKEAHLYLRGDDAFRAFVNGQAVALKAAPGASGWSLLSASVAEMLRPGANLISVECRNSTGPAGIVAILETGESGKRSYLVTDESWRVREERPAGWPGVMPAHWIWTTKADMKQTCYFERVVELADAPTFAQVYACGDNAANVFINGSPVSFAPAAHAWWVRSANATSLLRQGKNVIAVECYNEGGPGGLIALLNVKAGGKWTQVATDASWRVSDEKPANFPHESPSHKWQNATVLGPAGMQPWGFVGGYPAGQEEIPIDEKWQPVRVIGEAGIAPWGKIGGYPAPYLPTPAADLDARTQVELDWVMQDRKAFRGGSETASSFASLTEEHLRRAGVLLKEHDALPRPMATELHSVADDGREFNSRHPVRRSATPSQSDGLKEQLKKIQAACAALRSRKFDSEDEAQRAGLKLYLAARWLKRDVAFRNPLLDFDQLLFIKQYYPASLHEQSHRLNFVAIPGGGLYILKGLSPDGKLREVTGGKLPVGNFWRPDVSYDGKKILFCYKAPTDPAFRIYECNVDGSGLKKLTNTEFDDLDPIYLPNGKIMFTSTRGQTYVRCNPESRAFVLCTMNADGSDVKIISHNNEPDWTPAVMDDGRVLYTRWEYTDRALWRLQKLWTVRPDGTHVQLFWGNHSEKPDCLVEARQIPGTKKVVFTGVGHHQFFQGSLGIIDPSEGMDYPYGLTKLTPEVAWTEVEPDTGNGAYKSPYPLSEKFYIVSYGHNSEAYRPGGADFGIYLFDAFGNKELIYRDPQFNSYYAIPLKARPRPPALPETRAEWAAKDSKGQATGVLFNPDVYEGLTGVQRGAAKYLRLIEADYKTYSGNREYMFQCPPISVHFVESVKRDWGTVPVHEDGSVYFKMPAGRSFYFQLLDENYRAIQTMRSFVGVQPGEVRGCSGCHEGNSATPVNRTGSALRRQPDEITPPPWGEATVSYPRMVQPVLDKYCVSCHNSKENGKSFLDLTFRKTQFFAEPYETLIAKQIAYVYPSEPAYWGARTRDAYAVAKPLEYLSVKSPLIEMASSGKHYGVKVDKTSLRQLISWIDCNGPYYGLEEVRQRFPNAPVSVRP